MKKAILFFTTLALLSGLSSVGVGAEEMSKAERRNLFKQGAELWPIYCAQCHNARPGSEFAPYQWDQIMMHMRALPNMPAQNARAILEYLKGGRD